MTRDKKIIGIIGLGYVGLPLAVEFGKYRQTFGFDINKDRIRDLKNNIDKTFETTSEELIEAEYLTLVNEISEVKSCEIFIITVPTPIDSNNKPDLKPLEKACNAVGSILKKGDIVIFESTVYPGVTEEICAPILEDISGLKFNRDFFCGYSPERINPGDKEHRLSSIVKVTSGSNPEIAIEVDELYKEIIKAGTYSAESIKVAEAAKVIENTQRDVNIALINELSQIFNLLGIDTEDVLKAAGTKWNFLPFRPGLVGGHCIGVDPYYLTHKALELGYKPEIILAGRNLNDRMSSYIADEITGLMIENKTQLENSRILILGMTFKENCPDIRNTKVIDLYLSLKKSGAEIDIYDPNADEVEALNEYGVNILQNEPMKNSYDAIVLAVSHSIFAEMGIQKIKSFAKNKHVFYDVKHLFNKVDVTGRI